MSETENKSLRIIEHFGGSNSLEVLMELGVVNWAAGQWAAMDHESSRS